MATNFQLTNRRVASRAIRCNGKGQVTDSTSFGEAELPDGSYAMVFEMWDAMGNDAYSDAVTFDCENGEIWTTVYE